jgi:hypothetical protein
MLVGHLFCGLVLGMLVAASSLIAGHSLWAVLAIYVAAVNIGLFGSLFLRSLSTGRPIGDDSAAPRPYTSSSA